MVEAYASGDCATYEEVAETFGVGRATVSRNLRRKRETGDVVYKPKGHRRRSLNLEWLAKHAELHPDARLQDRADAWAQESGVRVSVQAVSKALHELGWSYKKRRQSRGSGTATPIA